MWYILLRSIALTYLIKNKYFNQGSTNIHSTLSINLTVLFTSVFLRKQLIDNIGENNVGAPKMRNCFCAQLNCFFLFLFPLLFLLLVFSYRFCILITSFLLLLYIYLLIVPPIIATVIRWGEKILIPKLRAKIIMRDSS